MTPDRFILASGSPRRRALIASLGITFDVLKSDIDETQHPGEAPLVYARRLCQQKAAAVMTQLAARVILAADTIVILATSGADGPLLGKPENAAEARDMLRRLRNRPHQVCTAFTVLCTGADSQQITHVEQTTVHMRAYSDDEIEAYIASGDPFDKAGGYAIQHQGFNPVARIDGCYNNVVGLPLCAVKRALTDIGWPGLNPAPGCDCPPFDLAGEK